MNNTREISNLIIYLIYFLIIINYLQIRRRARVGAGQGGDRREEEEAGVSRLSQRQGVARSIEGGVLDAPGKKERRERGEEEGECNWNVDFPRCECSLSEKKI